MVNLVKKRKITLMGGDARMLWLARGLRQQGYPVRLAALQPTAELAGDLPRPEDPKEAMRDAEIVIFGIPTLERGDFLRAPTVSREYRWEACLDLLPENAMVFAGGIPAERLQQAGERGITVCDLLMRPELAELNAIATAEGAVAIAMKEMSATLFDARCMVIGYGRCGSALARRLAALGAHVTATARRREQLARIYADGFTPCLTARLGEKLSDCEVVFNTVPAEVLTRELLESLPDGAILIELASAPGGIDRAAAAELGIKCIAAPGLPGKVAPRTAGEHLQRVILDLLQEREDSI